MEIAGRPCVPGHYSPVQVKDKPGSDDSLVTPLLPVLTHAAPPSLGSDTGLVRTVVDERSPRNGVLRL